MRWNFKIRPGWNFLPLLCETVLAEAKNETLAYKLIYILCQKVSNALPKRLKFLFSTLWKLMPISFIIKSKTPTWRNNLWDTVVKENGWVPLKPQTMDWLICPFAAQPAFIHYGNVFIDGDIVHFKDLFKFKISVWPTLDFQPYGMGLSFLMQNWAIRLHSLVTTS